VLTKDGIHTLNNVVIVAQHEPIYFLDLMPPKDLLFPMWLKPKNKVIATNTSLINSSP
jgi:hypothetical protein